MAGILPDCVKMLHLLTDLYIRSCLTREEYISHAHIKIAYLSENISRITNTHDRISVLQVLKRCCDALVSYNHVTQ